MFYLIVCCIFCYLYLRTFKALEEVSDCRAIEDEIIGSERFFRDRFIRVRLICALESGVRIARISFSLAPLVSTYPASLARGVGSFFFSPPRTYAPERVICRPDLENRGSVLDLSTRTEDVGSSGCPYATDGIPCCGRRLTRSIPRSISMNSL